MKNLLEGKRAVVTGGTRGIGKAIVKKFLESGASVYFMGTNRELGESVLQEMQAFTGPHAKVGFIKVDVADFKSVEEGFKQAVEGLQGDIQILVNNAGITRDNLLMKMSEEEWDQVIATNLKSAYNTCKVAIRSMVKARFGKIINISSIVGLSGNAGQLNYAASKAGLIGFTKSLAKEYGSRGVRANVVAPGFTLTAMTDNLPPQVKERMLQEIPLGRFGESDEVANAVLFLASPLSDYVTGQTLSVDGGMVMY